MNAAVVARAADNAEVCVSVCMFDSISPATEQKKKKEGRITSQVANSCTL